MASLLGGAGPACPWLLIQGTADEVVPAADVEAWARALDPPPDLVLLPDVDHFFHGRLTLLRDTVISRVVRPGVRQMLSRLRQFLESARSPADPAGSCRPRAPRGGRAAGGAGPGRSRRAGRRARRHHGPHCPALPAGHGGGRGVAGRGPRRPWTTRCRCASSPRRCTQELSYADKLRIIAMLWDVALEDRTLDKYEDYLIGKVAELLYVSRGDVVRLRYEAGQRRGRL